MTTGKTIALTRRTFVGIVAVVPSLVKEADLMWNPMSSSLGHFEKQQECQSVRTESQTGVT